MHPGTKYPKIAKINRSRKSSRSGGGWLVPLVFSLLMTTLDSLINLIWKPNNPTLGIEPPKLETQKLEPETPLLTQPDRPILLNPLQHPSTYIP